MSQILNTLLSPGHRGRLVVTLLVLFLGICAVPSRAERDSRETAREALRDGGFPWYDEKTDDLEALRVEPQTPPPEAKDWSLDLDLDVPNWDFDFWHYVTWFIWGTLIAALVWVLILLVRAAIQGGKFGFGSAGESETKDLARESEQLANLPFPIERPRGDLLAEARQHYETGDYGNAIVYLFSYQLVHLDNNQLIRLAKGKTNRQYLRELGASTLSSASPRTIRALMTQTMVAFEEVFFGQHPLDRQEFEACWQRMDEFHRDVQRLAPATN